MTIKTNFLANPSSRVAAAAAQHKALTAAGQLTSGRRIAAVSSHDSALQACNGQTQTGRKIIAVAEAGWSRYPKTKS